MRIVWPNYSSKTIVPLRTVGWYCRMVSKFRACNHIQQYLETDQKSNTCSIVDGWW
ncbi:hypothetical protein BIFGAL_02751 [Bifidobacterium gallicum DSM 20093 = LMG 11596]|uniref:Transmembrane protein n=1 Tax=Bifidobacterium gallicum DSM 20093 = LMG 11596 TaxID=561180 RepID=D1NSJ3_9BIFI|nr:hypothetical protein BIFGAL_02751 [Bifidobacterium gallicum DSM 20093 = LMG 11596]KFI58706.1 transmembrane protein [Bifidobacterium gallicum DSM 20093 = LMG 11596]